jgi:hypothetical protein
MGYDGGAMATGAGGNRDERPSACLNLEQNDEVVHVYISVGETSLIGINDGSGYLYYV